MSHMITRPLKEFIQNLIYKYEIDFDIIYNNTLSSK